MSEANRELSREVAWSVAITAMLMSAINLIDRQTLSALAPAVSDSLDLNATDYGWLNSAFNVAYLVGTPLAGWWIARIGPRRGLTISLLAWSAVASLHAIAPTIGVLIVLRVALGLTEAPGYPGGAQTMHRVLPPHGRARGFAMLFMGASLGGMIAPPLASFLYRETNKNWHAAFLGSAALGLLWLVPWTLLTRRADVRARLDSRDEAGPPRGVAMLGRLAVHPLVLRAMVATFAAAPVFGFMLAWSSKYLVLTFHVHQEDIGHYLWLPPLFFDAGAFAFGDLTARRRGTDGSPPRVLAACAMILATTLALLPLATTPWQSVFVLGVAAAGGGGLYTLISSDMFARLPANLVPMAAGVLACAQSLVLIIVNPLVGWSVDRAHDYGATAIVLGAWVVPGVIVWMVWQPARFDRAPS
jgi:ACS family hexuronate transporter-like MFS transporter